MCNCDRGFVIDPSSCLCNLIILAKITLVHVRVSYFWIILLCYHYLLSVSCFVFMLIQ